MDEGGSRKKNFIRLGDDSFQLAIVRLIWGFFNLFLVLNRLEIITYRLMYKFTMLSFFVMDEFT